jgi:hypothetical protein
MYIVYCILRLNGSQTTKTISQLASTSNTHIPTMWCITTIYYDIYIFNLTRKLFLLASECEMSKFTYTKNRVIIPLLLLSILSLSSATIYDGSDPPYLVSSVTQPKNLYQPPTVTDTDHQASDYWWDGTLPQNSDQQQKILVPNATLTSPLVPPTLTPTTNNKSMVFSTTTEDLDLPLSQNSTPPSSTQNQNSLRPNCVFFTFPGSNSEIFISPRFTTHFNLYCNNRHYETDNHPQLLNKFNSQFLIMFQCCVLHLSKPNSFAMIPAAMEQPTEFKFDHTKFNSSVSEWTH